MKSPFAFVSDKARKPVVIGMLIWTLLLTGISQVINAPLRTAAAPAGIVSYELAGSSDNAQRMITSWNSQTRLFASFGLGFDYLYMPSYAITLALACLLAAGRHQAGFSDIGAWLGWGMVLAAIFDAIENIGLWHSLLGPVIEPWPTISFWCAIFKFSLILIGIAYGLIGWLVPKKIS